MSILVVANAEAGSAERHQVEAGWAVLADRQGTELRWTEEPEELDEVLDDLGCRTLVVAGGDGSLHLVAQRLWDRGILEETLLGLVPLGTGNDLARGLGLPLEPQEAARVLLDGKPRSLDLLVDEEGSIAVNAVHAGLGAEAAVRSEDLKGSLGPLAYPIGAAIAGVRAGGWDLEVTLDGQRLLPADPGEGVLMVGVANGPSIGGGTLLIPEAALDDGLLDVLVVAATGAAARAAFGAALRRGEHLPRRDVAHGRGGEVRIAGDRVRYDVDGEVIEEVAERTYRLVPRAWRMLAA